MTSPNNACARVTRSLQERDDFILSHLTEVQFIARKIHKRLPVFVPLEDLIHSGVLGLLEATQKYDPAKRVQFKTFAQFRIRGAILDSLRQLDRASRRMRSKSRRLSEASEQLLQKLGRQPTDEEVALEVGLEPAELRKLATTLRAFEPVDRQVAWGEDHSETRDLIESAPARDDDSPLAQCLRSQMRQHLVLALSELSKRERQILSLYYFEQLTMQEIATVMQLKSSRISQIHASALAKLRGHLAANEIHEPRH